MTRHLNVHATSHQVLGADERSCWIVQAATPRAFRSVIAFGASQSDACAQLAETIAMAAGRHGVAASRPPVKVWVTAIAEHEPDDPQRTIDVPAVVVHSPLDSWLASVTPNHPAFTAEVTVTAEDQHTAAAVLAEHISAAYSDGSIDHISEPTRVRLLYSTCVASARITAQRPAA